MQKTRSRIAGWLVVVAVAVVVIYLAAPAVLAAVGHLELRVHGYLMLGGAVAWYVAVVIRVPSGWPKLDKSFWELTPGLDNAADPLTRTHYRNFMNRPRATWPYAIVQMVVTPFALSGMHVVLYGKGLSGYELLVPAVAVAFVCIYAGVKLGNVLLLVVLELAIAFVYRWYSYDFGVAAAARLLESLVFWAWAVWPLVPEHHRNRYRQKL